VHLVDVCLVLLCDLPHVLRQQPEVSLLAVHSYLCALLVPNHNVLTCQMRCNFVRNLLINHLKVLVVWVYALYLA
jgi:hypothetical protein